LARLLVVPFNDFVGFGKTAAEERVWA
jgi:hypothetical protein